MNKRYRNSTMPRIGQTILVKYARPRDEGRHHKPVRLRVVRTGNGIGPRHWWGVKRLVYADPEIRTKDGSMYTGPAGNLCPDLGDLWRPA
jgi:hypothetical protein